MFFPGDPQQRIYCRSMCPSRRSINANISTVQNIARQLKQMTGQHSENQNPEYADMFKSYVNCNMSNDSCNEFSLLKNELERAEKQLALVFSNFMHYIRNSDQEQSAVCHKALRLLAGHYPLARSELKMITQQL